MKTKLVLWGQKGTEEAPEKVLLALSLNAEENKVESWVFEGETATEEFAEQLMNNWRKGEVLLFPENHSHTAVELSAGGSLLPEGIVSTEKDDLLKRTQTEWLFIVLSTKLFKTYENEVDELRDHVEGLVKYSKSKWEELKTFQNKIQAQVTEGNLFREHTNLLRDRINGLFGHLKQLREVEDKAFESTAKIAFDKIVETLSKVENAVANNLGEWAKWFDKLKELQRELKNAKLTRDGRNELWERIDKAFKEVKDRRFGGNNAGSNSGNSNNNETRLQRRIEGLNSAIKKMQDSVNRDEKELSFQDKKINSSNASQLETQLREVKAKMVRERLESKQEKLADMKKTLVDLESRLAKMLAKQAEAKAEEEAKAAAVVVEETAVVEETTSSDHVSSEEVLVEEKVESETVLETEPTEEKPTVVETIVEPIVETPVVEEKTEATTEEVEETTTEEENKDTE